MFPRVLNLFARKSGKTSGLMEEVERARALVGLGKSGDAAAICEQILLQSPDHFDAVMLAAEIASGAGKKDQALRWYQKAAALRPHDAHSHYKLGNMLKDADQLEAALVSYDRAIKSDRRHANAYCNRGVVLQRVNRLESALASYERAIELNPLDALVFYNRGAVLRELKRPREALASLDRAIALQPSYAEALCNRGILWQELKNWDQAAADYDRAIEINPFFSEAHLNRGNLLRERGDAAAALASYERAIQINPLSGPAHCNRGVVLTELRQWDAARISFNRAIDLKPDLAEAHNGRGRLLLGLMQKEAALVEFDRALALKTDYAEAFFNRGNALLGLKNHAAAIVSYDQALVLQPDLRFLSGMRRHVKMHICDWTDLQGDVLALTDGIQAGEPVSHPFAMLALLENPRLQHEAAKTWIRENHPADPSLGPIAERPAREKIRVGYFSADFRDHPVAMLAVEFLERHDRTKLEVFAFSFGPNTGDKTRQRVEAAVDRFIDVRGKSDKEIAQLSRSLEIDIAIDLGGHTEECRTQVFALRAAPVQVNFLGYPGTMGADYIDYLLGDETVVPDAQRGNYSEKIAYLPHSFMPHDSSREIAPRHFSRHDCGLPAEGFVFCCFNGNYKITPDAFGSWMRILGRTGNSVLWLSQHNPTATANLRQEALRLGVDPGRLIFASHMPSHADHMARLRLADLFLDTRPYNAHATALDALWAGVPVLTCLGEGFAGRVAGSLLNAIDLSELVATEPGQYEDLAVELAGNPARLDELKQKLLKNRATAPLFDMTLLSRHVEHAYAQMHQRHRAGLQPDHIFVEL